MFSDRLKENLIELKPCEEICLNAHDGFELLSPILLDDIRGVSFSHSWDEAIFSMEDGFQDYQTNFFAIEHDLDKVNKILHKYYKTHLWQYHRQKKWAIVDGKMVWDETPTLQKHWNWHFTRQPSKPIIFSNRHPEGISCVIGTGEDYYEGDDAPTPLPVYIHRHMNGWVYGVTHTGLVFRFEKDCRNSWVFFGKEQLANMWEQLFINGKMIGHKEQSTVFYMSTPMQYRRIEKLEDLWM